MSKVCDKTKSRRNSLSVTTVSKVFLMALTILNVIVYFLVALCSFETFLSRTECQASRISLCRHVDDLSTSLFGDCEANGVWPTRSFHPMLLWPLCVLSRAFLVRAMSLNTITAFTFYLVHASSGSLFLVLVIKDLF